MDATQSAPPPDWLPVVLSFARDRSADGWMFTRVSDVRDALAERHLVSAVAAEGPRSMEDLILARVAVREDGALATLPDPAGPPVAGPRIEEVVSELAHQMKTVISVDGEIAVGTAGVPLETMPSGMDTATDDRRIVYAWPGTDRYVATAAVMGVKEELTWHDADDWTVLASRHAQQRVLTGFASTMERFPRVTLTRKGPERLVEYVAGTGEQDLRLMAWWGPWLEPLVDPAGTDDKTRELLEMLAHPRLGQDEMDHHPGLTEEQRLAVGAAMADRDGSAFLSRVCAAFGVPEIAARLAEQPADDDNPDLVGEPVRAEQGRLGLARAAMKEMQGSDLPPALESRATRMVGSAELILGLLCLAAAIFGFLPGPWWLWLALGVFLTGDGLWDLVIKPWRQRRRSG